MRTKGDFHYLKASLIATRTTPSSEVIDPWGLLMLFIRWPAQANAHLSERTLYIVTELGRH
jgi:hypothetical protein